MSFAFLTAAPLKTSSLHGKRTTVSARRPRRSVRRKEERARATGLKCVWVERSANVDISGMNCTDCFDCYSDLEAMPSWSPWLKSVSVDADQPEVSQWTLNARGMDITWKARNTKVVRGEIIQWVSETGLKNRGRVTFDNVQDDIDNCRVTLAVEFDVPEMVASAIRNDYIGQFVEDTLEADLKRFRSVALRHRRQQTMSQPE